MAAHSSTRRTSSSLTRSPSARTSSKQPLANRSKSTHTSKNSKTYAAASTPKSSSARSVASKESSRSTASRSLSRSSSSPSSRSLASKTSASRNHTAQKSNAKHSFRAEQRQPFSKGINNLHSLLIDELEDLFSAEIQIIDHLPELIGLTSNLKLKETLQQHLKETKNQVIRLKRIFSLLERNPSRQYCKGMEGILQEGHELLAKANRGPAKDACIIAAAQKVEHYEICGYGTARSHAHQLKLDEIAHLLTETFEEEVNADKILSKLAEGSFFTAGINEQAEEYATASK